MPYYPRLHAFLELFHLKFQDKEMENEYTTLMRQTNVENVHMSFYFLIFILTILGIPAIVNCYYSDIGITFATATLLTIIYYWKKIPRSYVQLLAGLIIASFNFCLFLMPTSDYGKSPKGLVFFRGYGFASIHVLLVSRLPSLRQKIFFLVYCYTFRFTLIPLMEEDSIQSYTFLRHIYIDIFVIYSNILPEKKGRAIFKRFYDQREELKKFKELLAYYLPQAITVVRNFTDKPLFCNQSFLNLFRPVEEPKSSQHFTNRQLAELNIVAKEEEKISILDHLKVDKDTIRRAGSLPLRLKNFNDIVFLRDIGNKLIEDQVLGDKPVSFNASHVINNETKSFEIILAKVKWDGEDAITVILNDTTDQEKIIRLRVSDANKDKIIATVSHELRTPLNGIIGILDIVEKRTKDCKTTEYVNLCKDNANLLLGLVNSLLDMHQIRQGKLRLNTAKVEVTQIVKDVTRLFAFQCKRKGIFLEAQIDNDIPKHICTDENRIKQILINLVGNALKFTSQGSITIEITQSCPKSRYIEFCVSDTGIGIREEDKDKLFKMYEKIEYGSAVNKNGVGLGLTISNTLAGLLSGKEDDAAIRVESKPGEGSKFYFSILKELKNPSVFEEERKESELGLDSQETFENVNDEEEIHITKKDIRDQLKLRDISSIMKEYSLKKQVKLNSGLFKRSKLSRTMSPSKFQREKYSEGHENCSQLSQQDSLEEKGCILAVDDNPFNLLVVENIVKNLGYSLVMAKSGLEAIDIMRTRPKDLPPFEVILMDCQMPIMDGFETTETLRDLMKKGEIHNVPIIALTANNTEEDIQRCFSCGMIGHLSKPLFPSTLVKALSDINL